MIICMFCRVLHCKNEGKLIGLALKAEDFTRQILRGRVCEASIGQRGLAPMSAFPESHREG
jgi:hypothetical protein